MPRRRPRRALLRPILRRRQHLTRPFDSQGVPRPRSRRVPGHQDPDPPLYGAQGSLRAQLALQGRDEGESEGRVAPDCFQYLLQEPRGAQGG